MPAGFIRQTWILDSIERERNLHCSQVSSGNGTRPAPEISRVFQVKRPEALLFDCIGAYGAAAI